MSRLDVSILNVEELCSWIEGLGLSRIAAEFRQDGFDGEKFINIDMDYLEKFSFPDRQQILTAADKLSELYNSLNENTLQFLALKFLFATQTVQNRVKLIAAEEDTSAKQEMAFSMVLESMSVLKAADRLIYWLQWPPFNSIPDYAAISHQLTASVPDFEGACNSILSCESRAAKSCSLLVKLAESLLVPMDIHASIPCRLHVVVIRRAFPQQSLGLEPIVNKFGDCVIDDVFATNLVPIMDKVHRGDEIIQINGRLIIGWSIQRILALLDSIFPTIAFLVKRRPMKYHRPKEDVSRMDTIRLDFDDQIIKRSNDSIRNIRNTSESPLWTVPESSWDDSSEAFSRSSLGTETTDAAREDIDWEDITSDYSAIENYYSRRLGKSWNPRN